MSAFPGAAGLLTAIFVGFALCTVAGALLAALSTRVIRGVCGLALCCVGIAGLYYFLQAPFLALMEILVYIGAVCVTIIFAVMLAEPDEPARKEAGHRDWAWAVGALVVGATVFGGIAYLGWQGSWGAPAGRVGSGSVAEIGTALLSTFSLAFELISVVLLVAILGALAIARGGRSRE
jgi:NADH-quinone oxidoreductase subunit J